MPWEQVDSVIKWNSDLGLCHTNFKRLVLMKKLMMSSFLLTVFAVLLTGCNTMQGVGQDLKKAGEAIENAAKKDDEEE